MIRLLLGGVLGAAMLVAGLMLHLHLANAPPAVAGETLTSIETELSGVPVIHDGRVEGYVIFKVKSSMDQAKLPPALPEPKAVLHDAAFKAAFTFAARGVEEIRRTDLAALTTAISERADATLGPGVISHVMIEQFNYVAANEVRGQMLSVK